MAEEFEGDWIWNMGDVKEEGLWRNEGLPTGGE